MVQAASASQSTRSSAGSGHRFSQSNASTVRKDRRTTSQVDFSQLESGREVEDDLEFDAMKRTFETRLKELHFELEQMQPNMKATERYAEVKLKVKKADAELEAARKAAVAAVDATAAPADTSSTAEVATSKSSAKATVAEGGKTKAPDAR